MAGVTVMVEMLSDPRFVRLARSLGMSDPDTARMKAVRVWSVCLHSFGGEPMTVEDIDEAAGVTGFCSALIAAKLAREVSPNLYYLAGSKGRLGWLETARGNGKHGRKGGRPRGVAKGAGVTPPGFSNGTHLGSISETRDNSHSHSHSHSQTRSSPDPDPDPEKKSTSPRESAPGWQEVLSAWDAEYHTSTGRRPDWPSQKRHLGQLSELVKRRGADEVIGRIRVLWSNPPAFLSHKAHDIGTLVQHFDKLAEARAGPGRKFNADELAQMALDVQGGGKS